MDCNVHISRALIPHTKPTLSNSHFEPKAVNIDGLTSNNNLFFFQNTEMNHRAMK